MDLVTKQELAPHLEAMQLLQAEVAEMKKQVAATQRGPCEWWMQGAANELFIGKHGKPVDRHTFLNMIKGWLRSGELVLGENYRMVGKVRYISSDFLKGKAIAAGKLRRA